MSRVSSRSGNAAVQHTRMARGPSHQCHVYRRACAGHARAADDCHVHGWRERVRVE